MSRTLNNLKVVRPPTPAPHAPKTKVGKSTKPPPPIVHLTILQQYRTILRAGLRAVQYARPARYQIHQKIRAAFETPQNLKHGEKCKDSQIKYEPAQSFLNTVDFLNTAARQKGRENDIVKNLCYVEYDNWKTANTRSRLRLKEENKTNLERVEKEYRYMIEMMNKTLKLELRWQKENVRLPLGLGAMGKGLDLIFLILFCTRLYNDFVFIKKVRYSWDWVDGGIEMLCMIFFGDS